MIEKWLVGLGLVIGATCASAQKTLETGNDFLRSVAQMERCEREGRCGQTLENGNVLTLVNRVQGIRETNAVIQIMNESAKRPHVHIACIPSEVTTGQLLRVLKNAFEKDPAILHAPFSMLAQGTLVRTWPC